jgi:hypothetical protein
VAPELVVVLLIIGLAIVNFASRASATVTIAVALVVLIPVPECVHVIM